MIRLIGGKYDGRIVYRDPIPAGSTLGIIDNGDQEMYRMNKDGATATIEDPYVKMDSAVLARHLP